MWLAHRGSKDVTWKFQPDSNEDIPCVGSYKQSTGARN
jgi:hypothetical protein